MFVRRSILPAAALLVLAACSLVSCGAPPAPEAAPVDIAANPSEPGGVWIGVAFLGDSLTAGLGLLTDEAYPSVIQEMLLAEGYAEVEVINAGISGDTTAGGLRRVEGLLQQNIHVLVVALGGNDALRGLTPTQTYENLSGIIAAAQEQGVFVLLAGMLAPTNLGEDYQTAFREVFPRLAMEHRVPLVPFLLEGVVGDPALNQADGIHPNRDGARRVAEMLYPRVRDLVDQSLSTAAGSRP
jgi:acyl-CoA thioesterase-1